MISNSDSVRRRRWGMLLGIDLVAALIGAVMLVAFVPDKVPLSFAKDLYGIVASSLSIIFSVFVAALATVVSASDNEFVKFLEKDGTFGDILWGMSVTLFALFVALVIGGMAYGWTSWQLALSETYQGRWLLIVVGTTLTYALCSTLSSTFTTIRYALLRARFLRVSDGSGAVREEVLPPSTEVGGHIGVQERGRGR